MNKFITGILIVASSSFGAMPVASPMAPIASPPVVSPVTLVITKPLLAPSAPIVRSFKEWKNDKVQIAIKKVTITKAQIEYKKLNRQFLQKTGDTTTVKDSDFDKLEAQLKNDLYSLEVAQELGVMDYFAIYLTKQENKVDAYKEAAQKMTPDEVNQLIKAYADSMFSSSGSGVGPGPKGRPVVGPTAMDKLDNTR